MGIKEVFDRNKCDIWNLGELDVPKLEDESIAKSNSDEVKSSADEKEVPVVFDRNKFDTWNFEDLGVPNLLETDNQSENAAINKKESSENRITHKSSNQNQYEDIGIYEDIEVKLPKDVIKEVKIKNKHSD